MKIIIGVKNVVDPNVKVRVNESGDKLDIAQAKMSLNPFDEVAIEKAVRLKEEGIAQELIAISIGNTQNATNALRMALALGCTRGILVEALDEFIEPISIAKILREVTKKENPDMILLGKQAIDDEASQVGQMLAGMLNLPQATSILTLNILSSNLVEVSQEVDKGSQILKLKLPAVLTVDLSLNEPRFVKLPQLMLARKKELEVLPLSQLGINLKASSKVISYLDADTKRQCKMLKDYDELIQVLQQQMTNIN